jgi:hypothetical protein
VAEGAGLLIDAEHTSVISRWKFRGKTKIDFPKSTAQTASPGLARISPNADMVEPITRKLE